MAQVAFLGAPLEVPLRLRAWSEVALLEWV
jgi:hypothetical protein